MIGPLPLPLTLCLDLLGQSSHSVWVRTVESTTLLNKKEREKRRKDKEKDALEDNQELEEGLIPMQQAGGKGS